MIWLFFLSSLQANIGQNLEAFFKQCGSHVHLNKGCRFKDQSAGYYTFGGLHVRNRVMNSPLATIQVPHLKADCGGIDLFGGGFSFINSDQLIHALRNITSAAASYAFMLGLETVSPQIANVMKQLQTWAQRINELNINSCEIAAGLTTAIMPRQMMASTHACRLLGSHQGFFSDMAKARHGCHDLAERERSLNAIDRQYPDIMTERFNVAGRVLQQHTLIATNRDPQLAFLFMSLTGTLVGQGNGQYTIHDTLVLHPDFLKAFLQGGDIMAYRCEDGPQCLRVVTAPLTLVPEHAFLAKVTRLLEAITDKIYSDDPLTPEERLLINSTALPIYKILGIMAAYHKGYSPMNLLAYADVIAVDVLCRYVQEVIALVRESALRLRQHQLNSEPIDQYLKQLNRVERQLRQYEQRTQQEIHKVFVMVQQTQLHERTLYSQMRNLVKE